MRVEVEVELVDYDDGGERVTLLRRDLADPVAAPRVGDLVMASSGWAAAEVTAVVWAGGLDAAVVKLSALEADAVGPHEVALDLLRADGWTEVPAE